jgi:hypothetical protein
MRLKKRPASSRTAQASGIRVPRRFGPASLTILGAPQVMGGTSGGPDCSTSVRNLTGFGLRAVSFSKQKGNTWTGTNDTTDIFGSGNFLPTWASAGKAHHGCSNSASWQLVTDPATGLIPPSGVTFSFRTTWRWNDMPDVSCASSSAQFSCQRFAPNAPPAQGIYWELSPAGGR